MLKKHFVFTKISLKIHVLPLAISGIVSWLILTFSVEEVPTIVVGRGHLIYLAWRTFRSHDVYTCNQVSGQSVYSKEYH